MCYNLLVPLRCFMFIYYGTVNGAVNCREVEVVRWYEQREGGDLRQVCSLGMWDSAQLRPHDHLFVHPDSVLDLVDGGHVVELG